LLLERIAARVTPVPLERNDVSLALSHDARIGSIEKHPQLDVLVIRAEPARPLTIALSVPLGTSVGYWHPDTMLERTVRPDWAGRRATSLVRSSPIGSLYDASGRSLFSFGLDRLVGEVSIAFGVAEEQKAFVVVIEIDDDVTEVRLAVGRESAPFWTAIGHLKDWLEAGVGTPPMAIPDFASRPVYSTWYSFGQEVNAVALEAEGRTAAELGMKSMFIDDGWQRYGHGRGYSGCGDWVADEEKFPDLRAHVARLHELGLKAVLWIAPLLLGERSDLFGQVQHLAPLRKDTLECRVFDPRLPLARRHMIEACTRVMREYGVDGLKIDFLDDAMDYRGRATPDGADVDDVGAAMELFLSDLRAKLETSGLGEPLIEFRQPYVSPALAPFGNVLRAIDCPADSVMNRTGIADARLSSLRQVVHSDMLMWGPSGGAAAAALQLAAAVMAVPQISMRLSKLSDGERGALRAYLELWDRIRATVIDGEFTPGAPHSFYPTLQVRDGERLVAAVYEREVLTLDLRDESSIVIVNGSAAADVVVDHTGAEPMRGHITIVAANGDDLGEQPVEIACGLSRIGVPSGGFATVSRSS